jgi:hypothetical protein
MPVSDPREAGSGKFKTPCERMHLAYSTSPLPADEPPVADAATPAVVVVVLRFATPVLGEPPPQLAASSENAATAMREARISGLRQRM